MRQSKPTLGSLSAAPDRTLILPWTEAHLASVPLFHFPCVGVGRKKQYATYPFAVEEDGGDADDGHSWGGDAGMYAPPSAVAHASCDPGLRSFLDEHPTLVNSGLMSAIGDRGEPVGVQYGRDGSNGLAECNALSIVLPGPPLHWLEQLFARESCGVDVCNVKSSHGGFACPGFGDELKEKSVGISEDVAMLDWSVLKSPSCLVQQTVVFFVENAEDEEAVSSLSEQELICSRALTLTATVPAGSKS